MDSNAFDNLARTIASSRRGFLKHVVAGFLGGSSGIVGLGRATAQSCASLRRRCASDDECCSGYCDDASGQCACAPGTEQCGRDCVSLASYQSDVDNCGGCRVRCRQAPECQLPACIDGVCVSAPDPSQVGQGCDRGRGLCQSDGSCACPPDRPTSCPRGCVDTSSDVANCGACDNRCRSTAHGDAICVAGVCGVACDAGYTPCGDVCCSPGECCDGSGSCSAAACTADCVIAGNEYTTGTINPDHDCQVCDPNRSTTTWSPVDDDTICGGVPGRRCCNGECCSPTECCTDTGSCQECGPHCWIDGEDIDAEAVNPNNPCQVCKPERNANDWSPADDDTICGGDLDDELFCCAGQCCGPNQCCSNGTCGQCQCQIGNQTYEDGEPNPSNACQVCRTSRNRDDWSSQPPNSPCGLTDGRYCCEGVCCPAGECCNDIGECETCGCLIDGVEIVADAVNPANTCQVCDPGKNREDWTLLRDGDACGTSGDDRICCGGGCCPQGQCCVNGSCQPCGCEIDGVTYAPGTINEANPCQVCDPGRARLAWSPVDPATPCGSNGEQRCCGGECCASDQCCVLDACGTCLCSIGGTNYPDGDPNPANACEYCDANEEPTDWTARPDREACGDDQVCCSGSCCDPGLCCTLGLCGPCGCEIDGVTYEEGEVNPNNPCQYCDPVLDRDSWSPADDSFCGESGTQVCCAGACCQPGYCCSLSGDACVPCRCEIDGQTVPVDTIHDECWICDPARNPTGWSPRIDASCGANGDQHCCRGLCCEPHMCCTEAEICVPCRCSIDGEFVAGGTTNPANPCEVCDPFANPDGWSSAPPNATCGANGDQRCCDGTCCDSGACCHAITDICGPGPCQCTIGDLHVNEGERNPDNSCETCAPHSNEHGWSFVQDNTSCQGPIEPSERFCCQGVCCAPDQCCRADNTCGPCLCTIDGVDYDWGERNPANDCEFCDPDQHLTSWTVANDHLVCGDGLDRFCCAGSCCPSGECCHSLEGTCGDEPCSCQISLSGGGTVTYPEGEINRTNSCEVCDPGQDPNGWSSRRDGDACGGAPDPASGACCNGTCCASDLCCRSDGACGPCVCQIDGQEYPKDQRNPTNDCQVCDPSANDTEWTTLDNESTCGANGDQICCDGICRQTDTCDPGVCEIAGATYPAGARNPDNTCETCAPSISTTTWTPADDHAKCGDDLNQVCCNGVCCPDRTCCRTSFGTCSIEWCGMTDPCDYVQPCGCTIDGIFYAHETLNPANVCQWCNAYFSTTDWVTRGDFAPCGPFEDQYCCNDICCIVGACCNDDRVCEFGSPNCAGCVIGGRFFNPFERNPSNPCQICDINKSTTSWSNSSNRQSCGQMVDDDGIYWGDLKCCEGVCCTEWYTCCTDGACGQGPCTG